MVNISSLVYFPNDKKIYGIPSTSSARSVFCFDPKDEKVSMIGSKYVHDPGTAAPASSESPDPNVSKSESSSSLNSLTSSQDKSKNSQREQDENAKEPSADRRSFSLTGLAVVASAKFLSLSRSPSSSSLNSFNSSQDESAKKPSASHSNFRMPRLKTCREMAWSAGLVLESDRS